MQGFDPKYRDPADFILSVTREIWEGRGVHTLTRHYAPGIVVRSPASVVVGNTGVIAATLATLSEFPDRELLGEDVIWCDAPGAGFLSSHRLISTATHSRDGAYGGASGRRVAYRIIADCHAAGGVIDDEWLVRDQGAICRQLGHDPHDRARAAIAAEGGPEACVRPFTPAVDRPGPYAGRGNGSAWGARLAELLARLMRADFTAAAEGWDRAAALEYAGGVAATGPAGVERFWLALRAALPSAAFGVEHVLGREDRHMPPRASLRWSLTGRHDGAGMFGPPSGAEVHVMGMTHVEFGALGQGAPCIRREWTLIDEVAICKQILLATGAV